MKLLIKINIFLIFITISFFSITYGDGSTPIFFPIGNYTNNNSVLTSDGIQFTSNEIDFTSSNINNGYSATFQLFNIIDNNGNYGGENYIYDTINTRELLFKSMYEYKYELIRSKINNYVSNGIDRLKKEVDISKLRYDDIKVAEADYIKYTKGLDEYFTSYFSYYNELNFNVRFEEKVFFTFEQNYTPQSTGKIPISFNNINLISKDSLDIYNDKFVKVYMLGVYKNGKFSGPGQKSGNDMKYIQHEKDLDKIKDNSAYLLVEGAKNLDGSFYLKNINKDTLNYNIYILGVTKNDQILFIKRGYGTDSNGIFGDLIAQKHIPLSYQKSLDKYISNILNDTNLSSKAKKLRDLKVTSKLVNSKIIVMQNKLFKEKDEKKIFDYLISYAKLLYFRTLTDRVLSVDRLKY